MNGVNSVFSVEQLFAGRLFTVPDYQRGYAWESQQIGEFLEDLELLGPKREHYTGTVVLLKVEPEDRLVDAEGKSYASYDIVDGQQRLATVVLLLDTIRRVLLSLDETGRTLADGIKRSYISTVGINGQPLFKLSLNDDCDHFFKTSILSDQPGPEGPQISSEQRLAEARDQFRKYLANEQARRGSEYQSWLTDLYLKVSSQLRVSLYQVESAADVGIIFEVMNNRGKPLSELEKVKNYLLYAGSTLLIPHHLDDVVNSAWAEIFRQLMAAGLTLASDEDQLLRAHWLTSYKPQPRNWEGSKSVKSAFDLRDYRDEHAKLLSDLTAYTEGLRAACVGYCDARVPERADSFASFSSDKRTDVRRWSAKLTRVNVVAPFLPLLIASRNRFAEDGEKYLELVRLCEVYAFRVYRLHQRRADAGQGELFRIGNQLQSGSISFDRAMRQVRATLLAYSPNQLFRFELLRDDMNWYNWAGIKYFLYEYEEHLAQKKGATPKVSWAWVQRHERADTIEHILPQYPTDPYWTDRFNPEERKTLTHDLGNLALTKDNASYGNKPFPDKRGAPGIGHPCYSESPIFMERELANLDDWNVEQLKQRRKRLIDWAMGRWSVDESDIASEPVEASADDEAAGDAAMERTGGSES